MSYIEDNDLDCLWVDKSNKGLCEMLSKLNRVAPIKKEYHTTATGEKILLSNLELSHLNNIISLIERKAKNGLRVVYAHTHENAPDDIPFNEDVLFGEKVKATLNYQMYKNELDRRLNK